MTRPFLSQKNRTTMLIAIVITLLNVSAYAAEEHGNEGSSKVHPVDDTKKAAKAVGHGIKKTTTVIGHVFRDGARAVGHGARKVTRDIGHAFRDGAHKITPKKD